MRTPFLISISVVVFLSSAGRASADPVTDFGPFGDDDGTELWIPNDQVFSFAGSTAVEPDQFGGFGFYYSTDPGTLITIFGPGEQDFDGSDPQTAVIDFAAGTVWDDDDGEMESTFTVLGSSIGFWLSYEFDAGTLVFYSESSRTGGVDMAYTFPSLSYPNTYVLFFVHPEAAEFTGSAEVVAGITPVPEPATALLLGGGLAGLALRRRLAA